MIKQTITRYSNNFSYYDTDEVIGRSLELYGEYGQLEVDFLLGLVNRETVVYDIGANIGYHTSAFATKAKKVYAFEPNPHNYELLTRNIMGKENVALMNCAVGEENRVTKCTDYDPNVSGNYGSMHVDGDDAQIPVSMISIDQANLEKPDLIKIDVEGSEYGVLKGAMKTIAKHMPIMYYEAHETHHFKEIYELLTTLEYDLYWAQVNNFNPNNMKRNIINVFGNSALFSIIVWPKAYSKLPLNSVEGPDDSCYKLNSRIAAGRK